MPRKKKIEVPEYLTMGLDKKKLFIMSVEDTGLSKIGIYAGMMILVNKADTAIQNANKYVVKMNDELCACVISREDGHLHVDCTNHFSADCLPSDIQVIGRIVRHGVWDED